MSPRQNLLTINSVTVQQLSSSNILTVYGDSSDKINLSANFTANGTQYAGGQNFSVYQAGSTQVWIGHDIATENINNISTNGVPLTNSPASVVTTVEASSGATATDLPSLEASVSFAGQPTRFYVSNPVVSENSPALVFTVTRTGDLGKAAAARYRTINDTAQAGSQYHAQTGYVTFAPGETTQEISITLMDDENLGPRQRQLSLGVTALPDAQAELLSPRDITFTSQVGSQLRNLDTSAIEPLLPLSLESAFPFESQSFNVSVPDGTTTLDFSVTGVNTSNTYFRWNQENERFEEFLFDGETGIEFLSTSPEGSIDTLKLHLVDGGRGDSDGVVNGVISGLSLIGQTTPGPVQVSPGVFYIPTTSDGQVQFHNLTANGDYQMGVLPVDDAQGRIGNLLPTEPGYQAVAQERLETIFDNAPTSSPNALTPNTALQSFAEPTILINSEFQANGAFQESDLLSNQYYSLFLSQGSDLELSVNNPDFAIQSDSRGYYSFQWNQTAFEVGTPTLVLPGQVGQTVTVEFELARGGAYNNEIALFQVDSLTGALDTNSDGVLDVQHGDTEYLSAVFDRLQDPLTGFTLPRVGQVFDSQRYSANLNGGQMYGIALVTNGTLADFLTQNPTNDLSGSIHTLFSFAGANPDGISHGRRLGRNLWGFEDIVGGGDRDFNDMILAVDSSVVI